MRFAVMLGTVNGFIILSVFYIVIIGLYSIVTFPLRKQKRHPSAQWQNKEVYGVPGERVQYQF
jgi:uncharacterized membrane protein YqhA